uniref:Uncharacterized protein n=1 Tax=Kryptolebias marmoratus TaxID=37003 RepID=A0A3Q3FF71_KRYMA
GVVMSFNGAILFLLSLCRRQRGRVVPEVGGASLNGQVGLVKRDWPKQTNNMQPLCKKLSAEGHFVPTSALCREEVIYGMYAVNYVLVRNQGHRSDRRQALILKPRGNK